MAVKGGKAALAQESLAEGDRLRRERRLEDAEAAYRAALASQPDLVPALHGLSAALRDQKRLDEALPVARRALELAPEDPWRHVQIGNILGGLARQAEAAEAFAFALELDHYLGGVPGALAHALAGAHGPSRRAAAMLGLAAAETPEDGPALRRVAEAWLALGEPAEAVVWLRRALARGEEVAGSLARALLACGRREGLELLSAQPASSLSLAEEITLMGLLPGPVSNAPIRPTLACLPATIPLADRGLPRLRIVPRPANPQLSTPSLILRLAPGPALPPATPWLQGTYGDAKMDGKPGGRLAVDRRGPTRLPASFWSLVEGAIAGWQVENLDEIPEDDADKLAQIIDGCSAIVSAGGLSGVLAGALAKPGLVAGGTDWIWHAPRSKMGDEAGALHPTLHLLRPDAEGGWATATRQLEALLAGELTPPVLAAPRLLPKLDETDPASRELADSLHRLPFPPQALSHPIQCERQHLGFQNRTFKLTLGDQAFALRLAKFPSARWSFYADENRNALLAAEAGIGAPLLYLDMADGTMLTSFITGSPLDYESFPTTARVTKAAALYRRIHALPRFSGRYDIFPMLEAQRKRAATSHKLTPPELDAWSARIEEIRAILAGNGVPPCSTHNDPIPYNFIEHESGLTLLDWQCAALSDPHWEIGAFCAQINLAPAMEHAFLNAYFGRADHPGIARALLYKPVCHFYWLCVALAKLAGEPDDKLANDDASRTAKRLAAFLADKNTAGLITKVRALKWDEVTG